MDDRCSRFKLPKATESNRTGSQRLVGFVSLLIVVIVCARFLHLFLHATFECVIIGLNDSSALVRSAARLSGCCLFVRSASLLTPLTCCLIRANWGRRLRSRITMEKCDSSLLYVCSCRLLISFGSGERTRMTIAAHGAETQWRTSGCTVDR